MLSILLYLIICSLALFVDSLTGDLFGVVVKITSDSPLFSIPSVALPSSSSATTSALLVPAVPSSGSSLEMGLFVHPLAVCKFAARVSPSLPVISSSIIANTQLILGMSSCIYTMSPTFIV